MSKWMKLDGCLFNLDYVMKIYMLNEVNNRGKDKYYIVIVQSEDYGEYRIPCVSRTEMEDTFSMIERKVMEE